MRKYPFVNHYYFHIMDLEWGHITIRMSGHPSFATQIILNGHEYIAAQARKAGIAYHQVDNCFIQVNDPALTHIAAPWSSPEAVGLLRQVGERWLYTSCVCFALPLAE